MHMIKTLFGKIEKLTSKTEQEKRNVKKLFHELSKEEGSLRIEVIFNDGTDEYSFITRFGGPSYGAVCNALDDYFAKFKVKKKSRLSKSFWAGRTIKGENKWILSDKKHKKDKNGNIVIGGGYKMHYVISPNGSYKMVFLKSRKLRETRWTIGKMSSDDCLNFLNDIDKFRANDTFTPLVLVRVGGLRFEFLGGLGEFFQIFLEDKTKKGALKIIKKYRLEKRFKKNEKESSFRNGYYHTWHTWNAHINKNLKTK